MRYLTAGESHGPQLTAIIEGLPSNMPIDIEKINEHLRRRQLGYGRGRRMQIEQDQVRILSGVRHGYTLGSPITLVVENKDYTHWQQVMDNEPIVDFDDKRRISRPRPGHADLNGGLKYEHRDLRNVLERSSARETAIRVAVGAIARQILEAVGIRLLGHVLNIGGIGVTATEPRTISTISSTVIRSDVRCFDTVVAEQMRQRIDEAKANGDTVGGIVEVMVEGVPAGLGSHVHWDRKLDAKLAQAMMSIQAFKGVEFGDGFAVADRLGSTVHDEIMWNKERGYYRKSNNLGGFEGGMTSGETILIRGVMKPIPTLYKPLMSVDIDTKEPFAASIERSDACAVPPASVVAENVVAWTLAEAFMEKFGADSFANVVKQYENYMKNIKEF